jgi:hypothetical protein
VAGADVGADVGYKSVKTTFETLIFENPLYFCKRVTKFEPVNIECSSGTMTLCVTLLVVNTTYDTEVERRSCLVEAVEVDVVAVKDSIVTGTFASTLSVCIKAFVKDTFFASSNDMPATLCK